MFKAVAVWPTIRRPNLKGSLQKGHTSLFWSKNLNNAPHFPSFSIHCRFCALNVHVCRFVFVFCLRDEFEGIDLY